MDIETKEAKLVLKAFEFAKKAHEGQFRKDGKTPYIEHPKAIYKNIRKGNLKDNEYILAIAFLHDVVEDSEYTIEDLKKEGFPPIVYNTIEVLTRRKDENYADYILRIYESGSSYAVTVKLYDLEHNMSDLKEGSMKDKYRLAKYILEGEVS